MGMTIPTSPMLSKDIQSGSRVCSRDIVSIDALEMMAHWMAGA
jgi:hypothetical protein